MRASRCNSDAAPPAGLRPRRASRAAHWIAPAALSLAAHGAGIVLGARLASGWPEGRLDGIDPARPDEPVTLHVIAAALPPDPDAAVPPIPEIPAPPIPEQAAPEPPTPRPQSPTAPSKPPTAPPNLPIAPPESPIVPPPPPAESHAPAPRTVPTPAARPASASRAAGVARLCTPADYLHRTAIRYPDDARREGWNGRVMLDVALDAAGRPTAIAVAHGSGYAVLDDAAQHAVRHWRFRPERIAGRAVPSRVLVPVRFELD